MNQEIQNENQPKKARFRRKLVGVVVSAKMQKTITIEVVRRSLDTVYKKYVKVRNRYKAHAENNEFKEGDTVEITENKPLSKTKRWVATRLISRPLED